MYIHFAFIYITIDMRGPIWNNGDSNFSRTKLSLKNVSKESCVVWKRTNNDKFISGKKIDF